MTRPFDLTSLLGVRIQIPPEAIIPILLGSAALVILVFFGARLAEWKQRSPDAASRFGMIVAVLMTGTAVFFLARGLTNQIDPNNEGTGQISFTDSPIAGGLAALAAVFWRMANLRLVSVIVGLGIGILMMIKPSVWPVIRITEYGQGARGLNDPEHLMFLGPGLFVIIVALVAGLKATKADQVVPSSSAR